MRNTCFEFLFTHVGLRLRQNYCFVKSKILHTDKYPTPWVDVYYLLVNTSCILLLLQDLHASHCFSKKDCRTKQSLKRRLM